MVQRTSEKASALDAVTGPIPGGYLVPVGNPGVVSYKARKDSLSGYTSVTEYSNIQSGGVYDCTAGIITAVAAAAAAGTALFWPAGTYLTTATIPLLHTVRHVGPGVIQRGSDTFRLELGYGQTNRLYVASSGLAANDGLSSSQPCTLAQAAANLRNYGPELNGTWRIVGAAGTYSTNSVTFDTPSRDWVVLQGPSVGGHPNVPTMVLDGTGAGTNKHAVITTGVGVQTWIQDVKAQNYNAGTQNSCGFIATHGGKLITVNAHASNCDFAGVLADTALELLVQDGIIDGCRQGVTLNATPGTVGYNAAGAGLGTRVQNCTEVGVLWSRSAQGHIDNCLFVNNPYHIKFESATRAHVLGNDFRTATIAAITSNTHGSYFKDNAFSNTFNDGTGLANLRRYLHWSGTGQQNHMDGALSEQRLYFDDTVRTLTNAAKTQIGADVYTLDAFYYMNRFSRLRIKVWGDLPNAVSSIGVDFFNAGPGVKVMEYSQFVGTPSAGGFEYECIIHPSSSAVQRAYGNAQSTGNTPRIQSGATTADMTLAQTIRLMGQSASSTITVRGIEVWEMG